MLGMGIGSGTAPIGAGGASQTLASVARTGIVASDGAGINISASTPVAGLYRISYYLLVNTIFTTSGPLVTLTYTDPQQAQTITGTTAAVGAGSFVQSTQVFQSSGAAQITYKVTSGGTFGAASIYLTLERLA